MHVRVCARWEMRGREPAGPASGGLAAWIDRARALEAAGIDGLWIAERVLGSDASMPAAWPLAAALSVSTTRLRLGVGPLALPLLHPLRLAEDAATVDGLSNGRLDLALGLGDEPGAYDAFAVDPEERVARFEDGVALLRAAFAHGAIDRESRHHDVTGIDVHPKPAAPIPLWIAADGALAARRAARLGARLLCRDPDVARAFAEASAAGAAETREIGFIVDAGEPEASLRAIDGALRALAVPPRALVWQLRVPDPESASVEALVARARTLREIARAAERAASGSPSSG